MQKQVSDVAALREDIAAEYRAAKLGLEGLNLGTSRHDFIEARQERVAGFHEQLHQLVGDDSIALVVETMGAVPDVLTRSDVSAVLRRELGNEEAERFCTSLREVWQAVDKLRECFGDEPARKLILAPPTARRDIPPS
jgi:hypothetical protein